jgi:hypothetical protein
MATEQKVPNHELLQAGLQLMAGSGMPLDRMETRGRAMLYRAPDGKTVRVRTCNDHVLVVLADRAGPDASLNIEGTDHLLVVMPERPRSRGYVIAYFVPTQEAVRAARVTHKEWLASSPNTRGENRTWNLWFDDDGPAKANCFARKWAGYRIPGSVDLSKPHGVAPVTKPNGDTNSLSDVIAVAKHKIASAAGVPESAIRISIDFP